MVLAGGALTTTATLAWTAEPDRGAVLEQGCEPVFRGEVARDADFERAFGDGLVFRLAAAGNSPPNPQEWTIEVRSAASPDHEYAYYASPPFRFWNPLYIGTSYGYTAERAVELAVREFRVLTNEFDYARARRAIDAVLWPGNYSKAEYDLGVRVLGELPMGRGALRIIGSRLTPPTSERPLGSIERLEFEVTLCLPELPETELPETEPPEPESTG